MLISLTVSPNVSSTFKSLFPEDDGSDSSYSSDSSYIFSSSNSDGSSAYGDYFTDVINLGDVSFDNFTVGLVNSTDRYIGVLGLGYNDTVYPTFTDRLVGAGLINSTAYSIWVDDAEASSGNILFGAIDTTKFEGSLSRVRSYYAGVEMRMTISSINATTKDSAGPISITYSADDDDNYSSGSSSSSYLFSVTFSPPDAVSVLPDDVASQIWEVAGAYYDSDVEMALIGCNAGNNDASTNFTFRIGNGFDGPNITATLEDLIVPATDVDVAAYYSSYISGLDTEVCLFGVQNRSLASSIYSSYYDNYSLGSSILRRTYSVFDLANDEIAIAPVKFGATETSNVVPFASYGAAAPSSTMRCAYSSCYETTSSDGTSSDGDSDDDERGLGAGILSVPALIGMSLGVGLGALSVGIIGFLIWRHRRNKRLAAGKEANASVSSAEAGGAPPSLPPRGAAAGAAPAPEMVQASHPRGADRGNGAPEIPMPENLASEEERPEGSASGHGRGHDVRDAEHAPAPPSRNA